MDRRRYLEVRDDTVNGAFHDTLNAHRACGVRLSDTKLDWMYGRKVAARLGMSDQTFYIDDETGAHETDFK